MGPSGQLCLDTLLLKSLEVSIERIDPGRKSPDETEFRGVCVC